MASLYELSAEYTAMLNAYDAAESEDEAAEILQSLVDIQQDIEYKADAYARVIRNKTAEAKAFKDEAKRLTNKAVACENLVDRLKQAMLENMQLTGNREINTSIGKWKTQMNPISCEVVDVDKVPMEYHIPQPDRVDRKGLIDHYKQTGEIIDGVEFRQEEGIRFR